MKEIVYDFNEFCDAVDKAMPIHYSCFHRSLDRYGVVREVQFVVYGISKRHGKVLAFEVVRRYDGCCGEKERKERLKKIIDEFVGKFADPLKATEGRWEP
jgi:hypothetical protein